MPFNQGPAGKWKVYASLQRRCGASWRYGETAPEGTKGHANEVQFVELNDGSIMLNARNQGGDKRRKIALSSDGGQTWSPTHDDAGLIEPVVRRACCGIPARRARGRVFLFSNPASQTARTNGTIRMSRDEGKTWPVSRVLYGAASATVPYVVAGRFGRCLFECDGKISFGGSLGMAGWRE